MIIVLLSQGKYPTYRVLPEQAAWQIYWNKRKCLHKKRVELRQDWFGTTTWSPFQNMVAVTRCVNAVLKLQKMVDLELGEFLRKHGTKLI